MARRGRKPIQGSKRQLLGAAVMLIVAGVQYMTEMRRSAAQVQWPVENLPGQFQNWTLSDVARSLNVSLSREYMGVEPCESQYDINRPFPNDYDPRYQFPTCITPVQAQGNTTSLAHSLAAIVSDRYCIQSKSQAHAFLNPQQLLECDSAGFGLGMVDKAWGYVGNRGLFNGSMRWDCAEESIKGRRRVKVEQVCAVFGEAAIMKEIKGNGPVLALIPVYIDFLNYTGGIYTPNAKPDQVPGQHAIEVIGWGTDMFSGESYWLVKNTWGIEWGERGFARISRQHMNITPIALAATPIYEVEAPEPKKMTAVQAEELDLSRIVL